LPIQANEIQQAGVSITQMKHSPRQLAGEQDGVWARNWYPGAVHTNKVNMANNSAMMWTLCAS